LIHAGTRKFAAALFATANTKIKNPDSIGDKVTSLILLIIFHFFGASHP